MVKNKAQRHKILVHGQKDICQKELSIHNQVLTVKSEGFICAKNSVQKTSNIFKANVSHTMLVKLTTWHPESNQYYHHHHYLIFSLQVHLKHQALEFMPLVKLENISWT
jgi:hypothetical protein